MASLLPATVGTKGQVTLPKGVRDLLGIQEAGEIVGFWVDEKDQAVRLTKLKLVPEDDFSEEEYRKLLQLPRKKGGKTFASMRALLKDLKAK